MGDGIGDLRGHQVLEHVCVSEQLLQLRRFWRSCLEYRGREESDGKQQLIIAGTAGKDAIPPPTSELSDGGCGSRVEDPEDDAVETTPQLLL